MLTIAFTLVVSIFSMLSINVSASGGPSLWTDKIDYLPEEIVTVQGSGFEPYGYYDIPVIRPDGSMVLGDGSFISGWDAVQADEYGNIIGLVAKFNPTLC